MEKIFFESLNLFTFQYALIKFFIGGLLIYLFYLKNKMPGWKYNINTYMCIMIFITLLYRVFYRIFINPEFHTEVSFVVSYFDVGFTKRILPGTILELIGIGRDNRLIFHALINFTFFITIAIILYKQLKQYFDFKKISLPSLFLFSPFITLILFMWYSDVIIMALFLISLICIKQNKYFIASLLLCISLLIHEMSILFFAPILGTFVLYKEYYKKFGNSKWKNWLKPTIIFSILPFITIFFVLTLGSEAKDDLMRNIEYDWVYGGISIYNSSFTEVFQIKNELYTRLYFTLISFIILSFIYIKFLMQNKLHKTLFVVSPFVALIILAFARDWGRFLVTIQFNMLIIMLYLPMIKDIKYDVINKYKYYYLFIVLLPITY